MRKNILILGSKPNAKFGSFDYAYCANAASSFYFKELNYKKDSICSLISASELVENKRKGQPEKSSWLKNKVPMLVDNTKSTIYLLNYNHFPSSINSIRGSSYSGVLKLLDTFEIRKLEQKVLKISEPYFTKYHVNSIKNTLKNIISYFNNQLKFKSNKLHLCSGLFRPSTGVLSLLKAINDYGVKNDYTVAGIGIANRGLYPDGFNNTWTPNIKLDSFHVHVDRFILEQLALTYNIQFTDDTLSYLNN